MISSLVLQRLQTIQITTLPTDGPDGSKIHRKAQHRAVGKSSGSRRLR